MIRQVKLNEIFPIQLNETILDNWLFFILELSREFNIFKFIEEQFKISSLKAITIFTESNNQYIIIINKDLISNLNLLNSEYINPSELSQYIYKDDNNIFWTDNISPENYCGHYILTRNNPYLVLKILHDLYNIL